MKEKYEQLPREEPASFLHREEIGIWSLLFFDWMTDTFKTGSSRPLQQWDLLPVEEQNKTRVLTEKLKNNWNEERKARNSCGKRPRLWKCILMMLPAKEVFIMTIFGIVDMIGSTLRPLLLGMILSNLISSSKDTSAMYIFAVLIGVISVGERLASHLRCWMAEVMGARISCALKGIVYSKVRTRSWLR